MQRTKGSQSEIGMMYQYGVTVLLAAKLSQNVRIENYILYSSDETAGKFDDVVARVKFREQKDWHLLLIQVKYKEAMDLNVSDTLRGKSVDYFLSTYIDSFNEIMGNKNLRCREGIINDNVHFNIFCNKSIQTPIYLRKENMFELSLMEHSEETKINSTSLLFGRNYWKFHCNDLSNSQYQQFFDKCCLYLKQPNYSEIDDHIQRICEISNAKDAINYVKDYFNNEYLYKQGLHKQIFEVELQRMRLYDCVPPLTSLIDLIDDTRVAIWNKITLAHDITIVNDYEDVEVELCLNACLIKQVNYLLNTNIAWKRYTVTSKCLDSHTITKFVQYCKTRPLRHWVYVPNTIQLLLIELWKCGTLPLVLKTYSKIDYIEKYRHLARSYIIINNQQSKLSVTTLKVFENLNNIVDCELRDKILENNFVSLQGRRRCTLKELLGDDDDLMATFTSSDLIRMMKKRTAFFKPQWLNGTSYVAFIIEDDVCEDIIEPLEFHATGKNVKIYCHPTKVEEFIKTITSEQKYKNYTICRLRRTRDQLVLIEGERYKLRKCFVDQYGDPLYHSHETEAIPIIGQPIVLEELNYINRFLTKATISRSFFNSEQKCICLVSGGLNTLVDDIKFTEIRTEVNLTNLPETGNHFIRTDPDKRQHYWNTLSQTEYPIIDISVTNGELELLRYRNCKNLSSYISYEGDTFAEDTFYDNIRFEAEEIIVVTGVAGIGKSCLLKSLCSIYPANNYILFYDLIYFQISLFQNRIPFENPLEYIFDEIHKKTQCMYNNFLHCLLKKNRLVVVLDSFDEIVLACEKEVLHFIEHIVNTGVHILISTRLDSCKVLIDKFNVRIIKINALNSSTDSEYLKQWKLSKNILVNLPPEFTTNPLYLNFLRMVDLNREQLVHITKFALYKKVIRMKIERALWRNNKIVQKSEIEQIISTFENMALLTMFGKETIEQELMWVCDRTMQDYIKFGIVIRFSDDDYPIFYHYSFVEFLVAQWISKAQHIKIYKSFARYIYKKMFSEGKLYIFNILSEDIEAHRAILLEDIAEVQKLQAKNIYYWHIIDELGRTALHIAAICCAYSRYRSVSYNILEMVVKYFEQHHSEMDTCDTIMKWNWTDYIQSSFFEYAYFHNLITTVEIYSRIRMGNIERCTSTVFPLSNFSLLFSWAIDHLSIEAIGTLLLLQNLGVTKFYNFYKVCSEFSSDKLTTFNIKIEGELSLLHIACIYRSTPMIDHLIASGEDVDGLDAFACTPLHYSIIGGSTDFVHYYPMDAAPFSFIKYPSSIMAVKLLLNGGADVNLFSKSTTALHLSVKMNLLPMVEILLGSGADINITDINGGDTPLHVAVQTENLNIIERLLDYNANQYIKNGHGKTAWDLALLKANANVIKLLSESKTHKIPVDGVFRFSCSSAEVLEARIAEVDRITNEYLLQEELYLNTRDNLGGTILHQAAFTGNVSNINSILNAGFDVNIRTKYGRTPLHYAAGRNNRNAFKLLLERGADSKIADKYGATPLHDAADHGNVDAVELLLAEKVCGQSQSDLSHGKLEFVTQVNINVQDDSGATPLILATLKGYTDVVELLLNKSADVNVQTNEGFTALQIAANYNYINIVKLLLEKKPNLNVLDKYGYTPLHTAVKVGDVAVVGLLLSKGVNINAHNCDNYTALHLAVNGNNTDVTRLLLENGADTNIRAVAGNTPLHFAANTGNVIITKLLLDRGVELNIENIHGMTPLHIAVSNGSVDVVGVLLDQNADANIIRRDGGTPLHSAVSIDHIEILKQLLNKKADVNAVTNDGETPLLLAVERRSIDSVLLLLEYGANINIANNLGITPLFRSIYTEHVDLAKILLEQAADINVQDKRGNTALHMAAHKEYVDIVALLLDMGANANVTNIVGYTPLDQAIRLACKSIIQMPVGTTQNAGIQNKDEPSKAILLIIELLLETGTVMDFDKEYHDVILHFAMRWRHTNIFKLLLKRGAKVNAQDRYGNTPLHTAVNMENIEFVKLLLEKGANADIENYQELTPLYEAVEKGYLYIIEVLINKEENMNA